MLFNLRSEPWRAGLFDAADLIETHGHCKGTLEDDDGRLCFIGAVRKAFGYSNQGYPDICSPDSPDYKLAIDRADAFVGDSVAVWNNQRERTAAEVVDVLRACAAS